MKLKTMPDSAGGFTNPRQQIKGLNSGFFLLLNQLPIPGLENSIYPIILYIAGE